MLIGVFDSGRGGHFAAQKLQKLLPEHEFVVVDDHEHVPYGERDEREIIDLTETALRPLLQKTTMIVLACNTSTAVAIDILREKFPEHHFIGYEPMLKPIASLSRHGIVLATSATRKSSRYQLLKTAHVSDIRIDEPDTADWAVKIEHNEAGNIDFDEVRRCVKNGGDVISLSCTHYLAIEDRLHAMFPNVTVIEPTEAIARRITQLVQRADLLTTAPPSVQPHLG